MGGVGEDVGVWVGLVDGDAVGETTGELEGLDVIGLRDGRGVELEA